MLLWSEFNPWSRNKDLTSCAEQPKTNKPKTLLPSASSPPQSSLPPIPYPGLLKPPEVPGELCSPTFISLLVTLDSVNTNTIYCELVTPVLERTRTLTTPPSELQENELLCVYLLTWLSPHWTMLSLGRRSASYSSLNHQRGRIINLARAEFPASANKCEVELHPEYPSWEGKCLKCEVLH